jgi:hypothetical protein
VVNERREERRESGGGKVVKASIFKGAKSIFLISGFEGSQAVPAHPSGRGMFERGSKKVWSLKERI